MAFNQGNRYPAYPAPQIHPAQPSMPFNGSFGFQSTDYPAPQMPNPQQFQQPSGLNGRFINSDNDVVPRDVPMDGSIGLFPKSDMSCIYAKAWTSSGTIETIRFVPEVLSGEKKQDPFDVIIERLDKIESQLLPLVDTKGVNKDE